MRRRIIKRVSVLGVAAFFISIFALRPAFASFSLSVLPYEGGYDLRFRKSEPGMDRINKEATVRITSDIGKQYRVTQSLLEPLSTLDGKSIPQGNLLVYAMAGSNSFGTLNIGQEVPVTMGRQIIYTSNQSGTSDSFVLVYSLITRGNIDSGSYRGRIAFTLEAIGSSQTPSTVILNISAEIENESSVQIKTLSGSRTIMLKPGNENSVVAVAIKGGFGVPFRILQQVPQELVSSEGQTLDLNVVNFIGKEARRGMVVNQLTPLSSRQQVIYTSSPRGEEDDFVIEYSLGELSNQKAGIYRGGIKYILEGLTSTQTKLIDTLGLEVDIPKIFDLVITPELGGSIRFNDLRPGQPPRLQEVIFEVKTNIGRQYQVTQNLNASLATKDGKIISSEYFTMRQESMNTKGTLRVMGKTPVKEGSMILFLSDKNGSATKFKVIYELAPPVNLQSGDYAAMFTYSVTEI
ncbi:MAG: hypothetical protein NC923_03165 [Candidatus Omnitrophica bacterium]|nr:hypothetical protein [Candidatus Omnitrophota bacterium]